MTLDFVCVTVKMIIDRQARALGASHREKSTVPGE